MILSIGPVALNGFQGECELFTRDSQSRVRIVRFSLLKVILGSILGFRTRTQPVVAALINGFEVL